MSHLRVFLEFSGHFTPILGDLGIYHVFPIPASCSTVNDVCFEIIKKYQLQSLASNGIELKINNKFLLLSRDKSSNSIREGDVLNVNQRVIPSTWKQCKPNDKKRKHDECIDDDKSQTPPHKKRKFEHINNENSNNNNNNDDNTNTIINNIKRRESMASACSSSSSSTESVTSYSSSTADLNHLNNTNNPNQKENTLESIPEVNENNKQDESNESTEESSEESSDENSDNNNHHNHNHNDNDNNNLIENEVSSSSNSSSNSTSDDDHDEEESVSHHTQNGEHEDVINVDEDKENRNLIKIENENKTDDKIETLNDALKLLENCKNKINCNKNEYQDIKQNDRIRLLMDGLWESGTVLNINHENGLTELQMDDDEKFGFSPMNVSLKEIEKWDIEPPNFAPPRLLKKIQKRHQCQSIEIEEEINNDNDNNEEEKIKSLIDKSGNNKLNIDNLKCDEIISYKILQLIAWEPKCSSFKMGTVIAINSDEIVIERTNNEIEHIQKSDLCDLYEIKKEIIECENKQIEKLNSMRQKRKKRKQKQKEKKLNSNHVNE